MSKGYYNITIILKTLPWGATKMTVASGDAVANGTLFFGIVRGYNRRIQNLGGWSGPHGPRSVPGTGEGFAQVGNIFLPFKYEDGAKLSTQGWGLPCNLAEPQNRRVLMVDIQNNRVVRWTWPAAVLNAVRGIGDPRYLEPPAYCNEVKFAGLHVVIDPAGLGYEELGELTRAPLPECPPHVVYVGYYADDFMRGNPPAQAVIFDCTRDGRWNHVATAPR